MKTAWDAFATAMSRVLASFAKIGGDNGSKILPSTRLLFVLQPDPRRKRLRVCQIYVNDGPSSFRNAAIDHLQNQFKIPARDHLRLNRLDGA